MARQDSLFGLDFSDFSQILEGSTDFTPGQAWTEGDWQFQTGPVNTGTRNVKHDESELSPGSTDNPSGKPSRPETPAPAAALALTIPVNGKVVPPPQQEMDPSLDLSNIDLSLLDPNIFSLSPVADTSNLCLGFHQPQANAYPMYGQLPLEQPCLNFPAFTQGPFAITAQPAASQQFPIALRFSPTTPRRSSRHSKYARATTHRLSRISLTSSTPASPERVRKTPTSPIVVLKKKIEHNRKHKNDEDNRPQDIYRTRPRRTKWGPFRYQDLGVELYPLLFFSSMQLMDFMTNRDGDKKTRKLTVWVQNTPAQVNNRYHLGTSSSKCRWAACPSRQNTILKGFWRVAFDEDSDKTGTKYDPFLNAGYMHLYCFEECFNLGFLIHVAPLLGFRVEPDVREFEFESRNPMSLNRDHKQMLEVFQRYAAGERAKYPILDDPAQVKRLGRRGVKELAFTPVAGVRTQDRLWSLLTEGHLAREVAARGRVRNDRGGANIGTHRGDLRLFAQLKHAPGRAAATPTPTPPPRSPVTAQPQKRKHADADDDDSSQDTTEYSYLPPPPCKAPRLLTELPLSNEQEDDSVFQWPGPSGGGEGLGSHLPGPSLQQQQQQRPQERLRLYQTRRLSKDESGMLLDTLASPLRRMTRRTSQALQHRLSSQPGFVQQQVLAALPEHLQVIFDDHHAAGNGGVEERIARLPRRQKIEVDRFLRKRELDKRVLSSLPEF